jgi:hypothetical protein
LGVRHTVMTKVVGVFVRFRAPLQPIVMGKALSKVQISFE